MFLRPSTRPPAPNPLPETLPQRRSRRAVLVSAAATATAAGLALIATPVGAQAKPTVAEATSAVMDERTGSSRPAAFRLPEPSGRYSVGTVNLHLIDASRSDPWVTPVRRRELMISLWYPAEQPNGHPIAHWVTAGEAGPVGRDFVGALTGTPQEIPGLAQVRTHGHSAAPVAARRGGWPVVVFSPGYSGGRNSDAAVVEDLASRGYLVVSVDHPHDGAAVEFPGGRVETNTITARLEQDPGQINAIFEQAVAVRAADVRFVLDQVAALNAGRNPDADSRRLPRGLTGAFRPTGIGMFGHSLGGATAAQVMHDDPRVSAGVNLDGDLFGPVATAGLDRPFLLMAGGQTTHENSPTWATFTAALRGWHREIKLAGSRHLTFHDSVLMKPRLATIPGMTPDLLQEQYGTIDGRRAVTVQRAYVAAFFDLHLRQRERNLFNGPSTDYAEISFVP
jgi:predicted dienelactone hydrolase